MLLYVYVISGAKEAVTLTRRRMPGLREAREKRNLTVRELGEKSTVNYPNISRIENGQAANPSTANKLAEALGIEVEELYEGFASWEIPDEKVRALYEDTYDRLRAAEKRLHEGSPTLFDELLDDRVYELMTAVDSLPPSEAKARLREQAQKIARRTATVLMTEAELEAKRRKAEAQKLLEVGQGLIGAA